MKQADEVAKLRGLSVDQIKGMAQLRVALTDDIPPGKYHIVTRGGNRAVQQLLRHLLGRRAGAVHGNGIAAVLLGGLGGKALASRRRLRFCTAMALSTVMESASQPVSISFFGHHYGHGAGLAFCVNMIHHNTSCTLPGIKAKIIHDVIYIS